MTAYKWNTSSFPLYVSTSRNSCMFKESVWDDLTRTKSFIYSILKFHSQRWVRGSSSSVTPSLNVLDNLPFKDVRRSRWTRPTLETISEATLEKLQEDRVERTWAFLNRTERHCTVKGSSMVGWTASYAVPLTAKTARQQPRGAGVHNTAGGGGGGGMKGEILPVA